MTTHMMDSTTSFMEVSYHSSDSADEEMVYEEVDSETTDDDDVESSSESSSYISESNTQDEDYEDDEESEASSPSDGSSDESSSGEVEEEDAGKAEEEQKKEEEQHDDAPVKAKAPVPLHQLLHNKLRNTNVTLTEAQDGNRRSVKDMAAAFTTPRPKPLIRPSTVINRQPPRFKSTNVPIEKSVAEELPKLKPVQINESTQPLIQKTIPQKATSANQTKSETKGEKTDKDQKISPNKMLTRNISLKAKPKQQTESRSSSEFSSDSSSSSAYSMPISEPSTPFSNNEKITSENDRRGSLPTRNPLSDSKSNNFEKERRVSLPAGILRKNSDKNNPPQRSAASNNTLKKKKNVVNPSKPSTSGKRILIPSEKPKKKSIMKKVSDHSADSSSFDFSVSSGTDESLAAKLGDLGAPFAPLPIDPKYMTKKSPRSTSLKSSTSSKTSNNRSATSLDETEDSKLKVSWSDLFGSRHSEKPKTSNTSSNDDGEDDDSISYETYETYETASSDEFETDSEEEPSKSFCPPGVNIDELLEDDIASAESSFETDTTYERKYAAAEGRTPPPPKKPTIDTRLRSQIKRGSRPAFDSMPVVEEVETRENQSTAGRENSENSSSQLPRYPMQYPESDPIATHVDAIQPQRQGMRRKPFENVPTAVAARTKNASKNDPRLTDDDLKLLGITGWDGNQPSTGKKFNLINPFIKKKSIDLEDLPSLVPPPSPPPFDAPDYDHDEDEISNITDRVFAPKRSKPQQYSNPLQEKPLSQRTRDTSGRFSITSFRMTDSVRNTERALEALEPISIEPNMRANDLRSPLSDLRYNRYVPEVRRKRSPALLHMENEAGALLIPKEYESSTQLSGDVSPGSRSIYELQSDENYRIDNELYHDAPKELIEEVFVGYDDDDQFETQRFQEEDTRYRDYQEHDDEHAGINESPHDDDERMSQESTTRKPKRCPWILCIVLCNLCLLLGIGTWLLLEYFYFNDEENSSIDPKASNPALTPMKPNATSEDIKTDLISFLEPNLPDRGASFQDETSPQAEALDWLSKNPELYTYDGQKILTRFALVTFYYATDGDNWTINHLWLTDLDECLWYTSSSEDPCTEERFSRLVLTDNNLQGTIPEDLSLLSNNLVDLNLGGTFTGEIPSNIGDLAHLTSLRLSGRVLSGQIPNSLYMLSKLSNLDLGRNILTGGLSSAVGNLGASLNSISLMENHLGGTVPEEIGRLSGLTHLNIDDNYFDALSEDAIGRLIELETLSARNNVLKGSLPSVIGNSLMKLKGLFLNNNEFTGSIPNSYGNLSRLEAGLDLSSNRLIGTVPESLGQLSLLRNLLLRDNALSGTIPVSLGNLSTLNTLRLDATNFQGEIPDAVCNAFNEAFSSFYADCWHLDCPCCNFCCDSDTGECVCRFRDSLPILCVEP